MRSFKLPVLTASLAYAALTITQAPAATADGRFGYILPSVRNVQLAEIPRRDKYAKAIAERLAAAASITAVVIPDQDTVSAQAEAAVWDCHGKVFFDGEASDVAKRDVALGGEPQADARMAVASTRLAQRFVDFTKANVDAWNALRSGAPPAPLAPTEAMVAPMKAAGECTFYFVAKRYIQAIAACNNADLAVNFVPGVTKALERKPPGPDTTSYLITFGLTLVGAYYFQAESHYQLGEPAAGKVQAAKCATLLTAVIDDLKRADPKNTDTTLQGIVIQMTAFRLALENHYPEVAVHQK